MPELTHAHKVALQTHDGLALFKGVTADEESFYLFIRVDKEGAERLYHDFNAGKTIDASEYGEILFHGIGAEPSDAIKMQVARYIQAETKNG